MSHAHIFALAVVVWVVLTVLVVVFLYACAKTSKGADEAEMTARTKDDSEYEKYARKYNEFDHAKEESRWRD